MEEEIKGTETGGRYRLGKNDRYETVTVLVDRFFLLLTSSARHVHILGDDGKQSLIEVLLHLHTGCHGGVITFAVQVSLACSV